MADTDFDARMMSRAMALALRGAGRVSPNPLVGAVVVRDGRVLGEGWHREYGGLHAEAAAIEAARAAVPASGGSRSSADLSGSTLYCNLEPCCYRSPEKHQPPCAELIIRSRVSRVVVANRDPNPRVDGAGFRMLRAAGIEVVEGLLAERGAELNEAFFHAAASNLPFVHLKMAQSLDGRIASASGDSKWITDERAHRESHRLRARLDAVLVGSATVRADDPELTVRLCPGRAPLRGVLSSDLDLPLDAKLLRPEAAPSLVVFRSAESASAETAARESALAARGVRVFAAPAASGGGLDLRAVLEKLYALSVRSVLVEGGSRVLTSFVKAGLYQKLSIFAAPLLMGEGLSAIGDLGHARVSAAPRLARVRYRRIGDQILVRGYREETRVHGTR